MTHLWTLANMQAKQLPKLKTKQTKRQQVKLLLNTMLAALRGEK